VTLPAETVNPPVRKDPPYFQLEFRTGVTVAIAEVNHEIAHGPLVSS
jgi:hypothetical protein